MNTNKIMFCICLFVLGLVTLFSIWLGYTIVIQASTGAAPYPGRMVIILIIQGAITMFLLKGLKKYKFY